MWGYNKSMQENENTISHLSSYSVIVFAVALFAAVVLDIAFPHKFFPEPMNQYFGVGFVAIGTFIVYWAEFHGRKFSHKRKRGEVVSVEHLRMGPYAGTRNPKYLGLGILLIGLGFILNSAFVTLSSIVSIIVVDRFLLGKEELLMAHRHGDLYHEYKKRVKRWL